MPNLQDLLKSRKTNFVDVYMYPNIGLETLFNTFRWYTYQYIAKTSRTFDTWKLQRTPSPPHFPFKTPNLLLCSHISSAAQISHNALDGTLSLNDTPIPTSSFIPHLLASLTPSQSFWHAQAEAPALALEAPEARMSEPELKPNAQANQVLEPPLPVNGNLHVSNECLYDYWIFRSFWVSRDQNLAGKEQPNPAKEVQLAMSYISCCFPDSTLTNFPLFNTPTLSCCPESLAEFGVKRDRDWAKTGHTCFNGEKSLVNFFYKSAPNGQILDSSNPRETKTQSQMNTFDAWTRVLQGLPKFGPSLTRSSSILWEDQGNGIQTNANLILRILSHLWFLCVVCTVSVKKHIR